LSLADKSHREFAAGDAQIPLDRFVVDFIERLYNKSASRGRRFGAKKLLQYTGYNTFNKRRHMHHLLSRPIMHEGANDGSPCFVEQFGFKSTAKRHESL